MDAAITGAAPATVTAGMLPAAPRATERREMGLVMWIPQAMKRFLSTLSCAFEVAVIKRGPSVWTHS